MTQSDKVTPLVLLGRGIRHITVILSQGVSYCWVGQSMVVHCIVFI